MTLATENLAAILEGGLPNVVMFLKEMEMLRTLLLVVCEAPSQQTAFPALAVLLLHSPPLHLSAVLPSVSSLPLPPNYQCLLKARLVLPAKSHTHFCFN